MKKVHYYSGLFLSLFIAIHFINHLFALISPEKHIEIMELARILYRNRVFEILLIVVCLIQFVTGINLFLNKRKNLQDGFDRLHIYSGLYLAIFLTLHPTAIFIGRYYLGVDTNFWFGAMVVNVFPQLLFFLPYYFLGVFAFFVHVACIHRKRVTELGWKVNADLQAKRIMWLGALIGILILAGFTGYFQGLPIPDEYMDLLK